MACNNWAVTILGLYAVIFVIVKANSTCVVYDFENGVEEFLENKSSVCSAMLDSKWIVGSYSEVEVESLSVSSDNFIRPNSSPSCITSFTFPVTAEGVVEVNLYMNGQSEDFITVLVMAKNTDDNDYTLGTASMTGSSLGWQTLKIYLASTADAAYIDFIGVASEDSSILVDSFRYIPPSSDSESCKIYDDENKTTTKEEEASTTPTANQATTEQGEEQCMTYNFENDFDLLFTTDNYICDDGFMPWHLDNYTNVSVEHLDRSSVFLAPNEYPSCITSFDFQMSPGGVVEADVYMEPTSILDHIVVVAHRRTGRDVDTVAGFKMYYPENEVFVTGWKKLRFEIVDLTSFEGYVILIGSAEKESIVLVDSIRYIPPNKSSDDLDTCNPYEI